MARGYSVYKHPPTHPADMIIENPNKRFVSDTEKETWNNKVDKVEGKGLSTEDYTTEEKEKLAKIEENANNFIVNNAVGIKDKIVTGVILLMKDKNGYYMRDDGLGNHMLCYSENGYFAFPLDATITIGGIE